MNEVSKKGLAIIYDPHSLQQFVWYYCTVSMNKEWDALCLPNGYKGTYMTKYCENAGIFNKVFSGDIDYMRLPMSQKIKLFVKMVAYYFTGRRKAFCKLTMNEYIEKIDDYDELVAICDSGFVSGLIALLGKEKNVSYLDDGTGDYLPRTRWKSTFKITSSTYWEGLILSKMGYGCKGRLYFKPTRYCNKYSAVTSEMKYLNYKNMYDMDVTNTDVTKYNEILERAYPSLNDINFDGVEAVFFTDNLECFSTKYEDFYVKCIEYISERYKSVLIKKHPRDGYDYKFPENVKVQEVDSDVPAELLFGRLDGKMLFFSCFSSIIIFMKPYKYKYTLLYSNDIFEDNIKNTECTWRFPTKNEMEKDCVLFSDKNDFTIIEM